MTISEFFSMLGGLGFFMYGMRMMRENLEAAAGTAMPKLLKKLTRTPLRGFLAGTGITAAVQSSTAVTVLLVGFVDAGILSLSNTLWVILGANIGTTITGQLTAVDMGALAPLMAFLGIVLLLFAKKEKLLRMGGVLSGVGMMFLGLSMVEGAMAPLGEEEWFLSLLVKCQSPLAGILAGTIFTALLQSSAASVGILQMLAKNGLIGIHQSIYMVFGQNMGTCFTALLASTGTSVNARRTAVLHLLINVLGTVTFLGAARLLPLAEWVSWLAPTDPARQIAHAHTLFNVISSLALLPLGTFLLNLTRWLVPEEKQGRIFQRRQRDLKDGARRR